MDNNQQLLIACKNGNLKKVQELLEQNADVNFCDEETSETPLFIASEYGKKKIVELLLDKGADINELASDYERTPLMVASENGKKEVVKVLLDRGADVNVQGYDSIDAMLLAYNNDHNNIVKILSKKTKRTLLMSASMTANMYDVVESLIEEGYDINAKDEENNSVMMCAINFGEGSVAELLLDNGADPHVINKKGQTAIMLASEHGNTEFVEKLIDSDVDLNLADENGYTALMYALGCNGNEADHEMADVLIANGADVYAKDKEGNTILDYINQNDDSKYLIEAYDIKE